MIPGSANPLLLAPAAGGYQVQRSLRFNSSDSAYLSRTPAVAGNRRTWTWAGWVKRSALGVAQALFEANPTGGGSTYTLCWFDSSNKLQILEDQGGGGIYYPITDAVYRDTSAWYHIVFTMNTTLATSTDRIKIYVNGVLQTLTGAFPSLNHDTYINATNAHRIGYRVGNSAALSAYLADIHFIDGQALTPSSFTEVSATTGQLIPKTYSGTYGTNGFQLKFADNSAATATTLGKDTSGNGNNWTPNNLSVTAGAGNDSLVDTPTSFGTDTGVGGEIRGNYCTLNPLNLKLTSVANGNLDAVSTASTTTSAGIAGTIGVATGKWYWEITAGSSADLIGIYEATSAVTGSPGESTGIGYFAGNGFIYPGGISYGSTYTAGDVIGIALDLDNEKIWFSKNGTYQNSGSPTGGTNAAATGLTGTYTPGVRPNNTSSSTTVICNFGQRAFAYTAPSGFKALCDTNLGAPLIAKPNTLMDVALWTGTGATLSITGLGFSPDFVWIKGRSSGPPTIQHVLQDTVRGSNNMLCSNETGGEASFGQPPVWGYISAFNSNGFTLASGSSGFSQVNQSSNTYVAWAWDAGTSTVSNTAGSITSQVRANVSAGFSVVTYTGTLSGSPNPAPTVGHGLGVAPALIISKARNPSGSDSGAWYVNHAQNYTNYLRLNTTAASTGVTANGGGTTANPTSNVFSTYFLSGSNVSGINYVAYCFAPVVGYSNGFSYTGNGSTDGVFQYLGFRPRLILLKCSSTTGNWTLLDTAREGYNVDNDPLYPNLSNAEGTTDLLDITSNGFKLRTTDASVNSSGATYIGFAWAENPFQYARAR